MNRQGAANSCAGKCVQIGVERREIERKRAVVTAHCHRLTPDWFDKPIGVPSSPVLPGNRETPQGRRHRSRPRSGAARLPREGSVRG